MAAVSSGDLHTLFNEGIEHAKPGGIYMVDIRSPKSPTNTKLKVEGYLFLVLSLRDTACVVAVAVVLFCRCSCVIVAVQLSLCDCRFCRLTCCCCRCRCVLVIVAVDVVVAVGVFSSLLLSYLIVCLFSAFSLRLSSLHFSHLLFCAVIVYCILFFYRIFSIFYSLSYRWPA